MCLRLFLDLASVNERQHQLVALVIVSFAAAAAAAAAPLLLLRTKDRSRLLLRLLLLGRGGQFSPEEQPASVLSVQPPLLPRPKT